MTWKLALAVTFVLGGMTFAQDDPRPDPAPPPPAKAPAPPPPKQVPAQADLEKEFEKTLTGATLVGQFTIEGRGRGDGQPKEERYQINKVTKMRGDYWLFAARVQYGKKDVTVPMMLQVKWAGDTPVITLTDLAIPGLGTYTARVMIFRDHYAGYWSGTDHGGNLFGRIERTAGAAAEAPDAPAEPPQPREGATVPGGPTRPAPRPAAEQPK